MGAKPLVPKLRFKEFHNGQPWPEEVPLGSFASIHKGRGIAKGDIQPDGSLPCIRYGELYTRYGEVVTEVFSRTNLPRENLFLSKSNDVLIPASGESKDDIATAACVMLDGVALGSDLNVLRTLCEGAFLSYLLNGPKRRAIAKVAQGDTVVHLYPSQLAQITVSLPSAPEQRKIAECLMSLDELIAAEGRKLEVLRTHKKSLMQKLFPREGKTTPRLRFAEFGTSEEWGLKKIAHLLKAAERPVEMDGDQVFSLVTVKRRYGGVVSREILQGSAIKVKTQFTVRTDDFLISKRQIVHNACGLVPSYLDGSIVSNEYSVLTPREGCDIRFFSYFAQQRQVSKSFLDSSVGIVIEKMLFKLEWWLNHEFLFPSVREQERIASCLGSLDTLINEQAKKLDTLKTHKQGLMQGLFPTPPKEVPDAV